jgi:hypothetical protein
MPKSLSFVIEFLGILQMSPYRCTGTQRWTVVHEELPLQSWLCLHSSHLAIPGLSSCPQLSLGQCSMVALRVFSALLTSSGISWEDPQSLGPLQQFFTAAISNSPTYQEW